MANNYFVYITTNPAKTVLYVGMTNDLYRRMVEHYKNRGEKRTFAGRYYCHKLVYYERFSRVVDALDREKELKGWRREKKLALIQKVNPYWRFLNENLKGD